MIDVTLEKEFSRVKFELMTNTIRKASMMSWVASQNPVALSVMPQEKILEMATEVADGIIRKLITSGTLAVAFESAWEVVHPNKD